MKEKVRFKCESCVSKKEKSSNQLYGYCEVCGQRQLCYDTSKKGGNKK